MNQIVLISGLASEKIVNKLEVPAPIPPDLSLMDFLTNNGITIASSCGGAGTCKKCIVNRDMISCQVTLQDFVSSNPISVVEISYL